jgi:predicted Zn-dependent protease
MAGCTYMPDAVRNLFQSEAGKGLVQHAQEHLLPEVVDRLGDWAFELKLKTVHVSHNPRSEQAITEVMNRLVRAADGTPYAEVAKKFRWQATLFVKDDVPNAFAVPSGRIGVYTGLLRLADTGKHGTQDVLAAVLGHEIVHALARHAADRMSAELRQELALATTGLQLETGGLSPEATAGVMVAMGISQEGAVMRPFAREQESEADHVGLLLMAKAGFDPQAAVAFWTTLQSASAKTHMPELLSVHPTDEVRIKQLNDWMPEALEQYRLATRNQRVPVAGVSPTGKGS